MSRVSPSSAIRVIRVRNTTDTTQELWLEPLGDRIVLKPDVFYELTATDDLEEIDFSPPWIYRLRLGDSRFCH